jgi:hypothetical protein
VQRRDDGPGLDRRDDLVVDDGRIDRQVAKMDDPVPDGIRLLEVVDGGRAFVRVDERELQARRARIDDEDPAQKGQVQSRMAGSSSP